MTAYTGTKYPWQRIADHLRARIEVSAPGFAIGDPVLSEERLAHQQGVTRMTARRALVELTQEGLLAPGKPRRVARAQRLRFHVTRTADRTWEGETATAGADSWLADMARGGHQPTQDIEVVTQAAGGESARRLGLGDGATVTVRRLTRYVTGRPHNGIKFWFPYRIAEHTPLAGPASVTEGTVAWLENKYGPLTHEPPEISARPPTPAEASQLQIPGGIWVLTVWRTSLAGTRPVVTSMAVYPADRATLLIEP